MWAEVVYTPFLFPSVEVRAYHGRITRQWDGGSLTQGAGDLPRRVS